MPGSRPPHVDRNDGALLDAQIVSFDKTNDVAVLRVAGLHAPPLQLGDAEPGTAGGLLGYPGNGPYTETAVRIGRIVQIVGRDAYGNFPVSRRVMTIRGVIRSGNSGGPVVDAQGRVITTVFAQRVGTDGGYGVPNSCGAGRAGSRRHHARSRRPAPTVSRLFRAAGRARPRAA